MNHRLAGILSCVTVVLAAAAGWWLLRPAVLTDAAAPAADPTAFPAAGRIEQLARGMAAQAGPLAYAGLAETLPRPRQGYLVTFLAERASGRAAERDEAARRAWHERFCTAPLLATMREEGVQVVTGRVVDGSGHTLYAADCLPAPARETAGQSAVPPSGQPEQQLPQPAPQPGMVL
ncbi:hypothetical protein IP91_00746 [Pseudoduganella lurida]|uniref:Uncharacterized protein n=1 Tax=Pseudoduganella lurida TaxID=1036180 RepID=A0A562RLA8_9BURK|nr:hypothetical protein [Pseudoduganella lurida]TWI69673.1 hypothetical protein IP91_00746 [Pseudoduganella lurida]